MPDPIKMPAPPLAPGQVEVKLGAKRYVLNVPAGTEEDVRLGIERQRAMKFHPNAFSLVWPAVGDKPEGE